MREKLDTILPILRNIVKDKRNKPLDEKCAELIEKINESYPNDVNINNRLYFHLFTAAFNSKPFAEKGELILITKLLLTINPQYLTFLDYYKETIFEEILSNNDIEGIKFFFSLFEENEKERLIYNFIFLRENKLTTKEINFLFDSLTKEECRSLITYEDKVGATIKKREANFPIFYLSNPAIIERAFYEIFDDEKLLDEACKVHPYLIDLRNNPPEKCKVKITNHLVKALLPLALTAKDPLIQIFKLILPNDILKIIVGYIIPQVNILNYNTFNYLANVMLGDKRDMGKLSELFNLAIMVDNVPLLNNVQPQDPMKSLNPGNNLPRNQVEIPNADRNNNYALFGAAALTSLIVSITLPSMVPTSYAALASSFTPIAVGLSVCTIIGSGTFLIYNNFPNLFKSNDIQTVL